jgi:integrase/recombinase XerD
VNESEQNITVVNASVPAVRQADTDEQLVALWLHGRSPGTQRVYRSDSDQFFAFAPKPMSGITLGDVQAFADHLVASGLKPATRHRKLSAVKSLFAFAHRLGYLPFDVARPLLLPSYRDGLAERILEEADILRMITLEPQPRNHALLVLFYAGALRASELRGLTWGSMQSRTDGGQVTVFGKGGKTRTVLLPAKVWAVLVKVRNGAADDAPIFRSRKGGHLSAPQVWRIVRNAAMRAGLQRAVSPHWLRHGHASHALDRGAPVHLVQATLGHASVATTGRYLHARPTDSSSNYLPL